MSAKPPINPLMPPPAVLQKLAALVVYAQENAPEGGQIRNLSRELEIVAWLYAMRQRGLVVLALAMLVGCASAPRRAVATSELPVCAMDTGASEDLSS